MKKNEPCINTTAKLWISHILVYYFVFVSLSNLVMKGSFFHKESLKMLFASPLIGLMGFLDHFPGFFIFPIIFMLVFYYRYFEQKIYKSYLVSLLISYFLLYIYLFSIGGLKSDFMDVNVFLFIIPSLAVTLSVNWFLFGRHENQKKN
ncbi:hypothetical protein FNW52_14330 [Flavobacterium sp. ZT3R18]|uniref:hypothetical protein n=1 Tax=Flavobacterium sp. ZT3R18 TaxID=2594429 RepID=UPI00117AEF3E|nr:hypothetical protein [Flavobacterium sp. ZT3R18]TRX34206.1 hypothetical protein FNW52_14330 [Flavobacterium sp. ZT3R18]